MRTPLSSTAQRRSFVVFGLSLFAVLSYTFFGSALSSAQENSRSRGGSDQLAGTFTGRVFQDFNGNGTYDSTGGTAAAPTAIDTGVSGVTVSAYDAGNVLRGSSTTAADGTYSLTVTGVFPYRIEFTGLPAGFVPSARSRASAGPGFNSSNAGSTVQFVNADNVADINLAINRPYEYCQNNPLLCSHMYGFGNDNTPAAAFTVPFYAGSTQTTGTLDLVPFRNPAATSIATANQIGTTFGITYDRSSRRIFTAAFMKKHAKFGPSGPGAIYQIDQAGAISTYVNLNTVFSTAVAGTDPHDTSDWDRDNGNVTWNAVGKIGLGGLAISDTGSHIYALGLANRTLYKIPTSGTLNSTTITSVAFPTSMPNCSNAVDVRPFAVAWYQGRIYVGAVCSQESAAATINGDLRAYVYSLDPATLTWNTTPHLNVPLNYTRRNANGGVSGNWLNWRNVFSNIGGGNWIYPQPMLTDIDFERGNMVLSFRDRTGDQTGYQSLSDPNSGTRTKGITAGEILKACGNPTSGWTLESGARCGGDGTGPVANNSGPGGGEFYFQDNYRPNSDPHDEVGVGGAVQVPGVRVLAATLFDPVFVQSGTVFDAGGIRWFVNSGTAAGTQNRGWLGYEAGTPHFGKANGMGNLVALCDAAPLEIGNRVWYDANRDGIQGPGEGPIAGVTVHLYRNGVLVGTAITDANGEYYFVGSATADPNPGDNIGQVVGGILPNTVYEIRFDNPADYSTGGPLNGRALTIPNRTTHAGDVDATDSDATLVTNPAGSPTGSFPVISVTTGGPGVNNHTLDVGFSMTPTAAAVSVSGQVLTSDGRGIRNVQMRLELADGTVKTAITGPFGYYRFDGVASGQTGVIAASAKHFTFIEPVRPVKISDELSNINFIAQ